MKENSILEQVDSINKQHKKTLQEIDWLKISKWKEEIEKTEDAKLDVFETLI